MSILLIPNNDNTGFIEIKGLSSTKAKFFIEDFQRDLMNDDGRRPRQAFPHLATDDDVIEYLFDDADELSEFCEDVGVEVFMDFDSANPEEIPARNMATSGYQGVRGNRAAFVDFETATLTLGTSVVFNERHFTTNFKDPTIEQAFEVIDIDTTIPEADPLNGGQATQERGVDLNELIVIAGALRARAKPKLVDAVFDRDSQVDVELLALAERLEQQVILAGGTLEVAKIQVREAADELIQSLKDGGKQLRNSVEGGISKVRSFLRDLDRK